MPPLEREETRGIRPGLWWPIILVFLFAVWFSAYGGLVLTAMYQSAFRVHFAGWLVGSLMMIVLMYALSIPVFVLSMATYILAYRRYFARDRLLLFHLIGGLCGTIFHTVYLLLILGGPERGLFGLAMIASGFTAGVAGSVIFVRAYEGIWWRR